MKADNLAGAAAARWLALSAEERQTTGLMAPSHALRERINAIVRERLTRDGIIDGPATDGERLVSRGYTNAEKSLAANYTGRSEYSMLLEAHAAAAEGRPARGPRRYSRQ